MVSWFFFFKQNLLILLREREPPTLYPTQGINTNIQHANRGHGQHFVFRRQMRPTRERYHDDNSGAPRELGQAGVRV